MRPRKNAFTLIELLVVISIIALLVAILMPALNQARAQAQMAVCASQLKQVGIAIGIYKAEHDTDKIWKWNNGTADHPNEYCGGGGAKIHLYLVDKYNLLPTREIFFCPGVRNISYDVNYIRNGSTYQYLTLNQLKAGPDTCYNGSWCADNGYPAKHFRFWSTYFWLWEKKAINQILQVNLESKDILMGDMAPGFWQRVIDTQSWMTGSGVNQGIEHYNALMFDGHVERPAQNNEDWNYWLFGNPYFAGDPSYGY